MKTIALFFGGPSNEHEVSIVSAKNIYKNIERNKFNIKLVYWDKNRLFYLVKDFSKLKTNRKRLQIENFKKNFDIAFPITHGKYGEDGVLQSIFESQKIRYCGCRVLSSALCMDKAIFKDLISAHKINQVNYVVLDYILETKKEINSKLIEIKCTFNFPLFVKPANSGSSVGITRVEKMTELKRAIAIALIHDNKVLIEEGLVAPREIEVAVLGNNEVFVSQAGELKLAKDFYDYEDKYKLNKTEFIIPAKISDRQSDEIKRLSKKVYQICACSGFARIDFFIANNKIYLNELNTLPGFTNISMYPMLMEKSGVKYLELIEKIINLA